jgi:hypothetical protein
MASVTVSFAYSGQANVQWIVPAGASGGSVNVTLKGAGGGRGAYAVGGYVSGKLSCNPGDVLFINVGAFGLAPQGSKIGGKGGFNGGAPGGDCTSSSGLPGYGGGGASDIRKGGTALANRVAVAGGGGGSGGVDFATFPVAYGGLGGAATGGTGDTGKGSHPGTGGTQAAGGTAGAAGTGVTSVGANGALGVGGKGANTSHECCGGGGGGGYYGGGGGGNVERVSGAAAGGGGGSNYVGGLQAGATSTRGTGSKGGTNGSVTITYGTTPSTPILYPPNSSSRGSNRGLIPRVDAYASRPLLLTAADTLDTNIANMDIRYRVNDGVTTPGAWTTVNLNGTGGNGSGTGTLYVAPGTLAASTRYEWTARVTDTNALVSDWAPSNYFTAQADPAAAFPFADLPDQWPDYSTTPHVLNRDDMAARTTSAINKVAELIAHWAGNYGPDPTRQADVGFDVMLSSGVVAGGANIAWDLLTEMSEGWVSYWPAALGGPGQFLCLMPGTYIIGAHFDGNNSGAAADVRFVGLPAYLSIPTLRLADSGMPSDLEVVARLVGGELIAVFASAAFTCDPTTAHFYARRIGP